MNDDDLERSLLRLRPADLPGSLQRRLHAAEPTARTSQPLPHPPGWLIAWFRPWPLAYAGLAAAWTVILVLHLFTQVPPLPDKYVPVARSSGHRDNPLPPTLTAGFSLDRAILLTRNNDPDSIWP